MSQDPAVMQRFEKRLAEDDELRDLFYDRYDQLYAELDRAVYAGDIQLGLFTDEELAMWMALLSHRLNQSGVDWRAQDKLAQENAEAMAESVVEMVRLLNTPERRVRWRERLDQIAREDPPGEVQSLLLLLEHALADSDQQEELESWLIKAFAGEHASFKRRQATDTALAERVRAVYKHALERLEQGKPLLL
jgi:hypothetical protein